LYTNSKHLILNIFKIILIYSINPIARWSRHKIKTIRLNSMRISQILISCFYLPSLKWLNATPCRSSFNSAYRWSSFHLRICLILSWYYTDNILISFWGFNHPPRDKGSILSFNKLLVFNFQLNYLFNLPLPWFLLLLLCHQLNFLLYFLVPNLA
jgi:hypothetical protein